MCRTRHDSCSVLRRIIRIRISRHQRITGGKHFTVAVFHVDESSGQTDELADMGSLLNGVHHKRGNRPKRCHRSVAGEGIARNTELHVWTICQSGGTNNGPFKWRGTNDVLSGFEVAADVFEQPPKKSECGALSRKKNGSGHEHDSIEARLRHRRHCAGCTLSHKGMRAKRLRRSHAESRQHRIMPGNLFRQLIYIKRITCHNTQSLISPGNLVRRANKCGHIVRA
jgi:hypothetical protein